jgi:hypothetical protein
VNLDLVVLKQSSSEDGMGGSDTTTPGVDVVKIGNVTAAANSFGHRVLLHSSIVALNDETALLLTTNGESLKISKVTIPVPTSIATGTMQTSPATSNNVCDTQHFIWLVCACIVISANLLS